MGQRPMTCLASAWISVRLGVTLSFFLILAVLRNRKYLLVTIEVIAAYGMFGRCEGPTAVHRCSTRRSNRLKKKYFAHLNGLPSRDCLRWLLMALEPLTFQQCFQVWINDAVLTEENSPSRRIAIDGKTCRHSHALAQDLGPLHVVSSWASEEEIALGQVAIENKSKESTAIRNHLAKQQPAQESLEGKIQIAGWDPDFLARPHPSPSLHALAETFVDDCRFA